MIIDAHVHWRGGTYSGDHRGGPGDLFGALEQAGVSRAVVVGLDPEDDDSIVDVTTEWKDRLAAFIDVDPAKAGMPAVEEAVRVASGLGESYVRCGSSQLPEEYFRPVLEIAQAEELPVMLHTGDFSYTSPAMMGGMIQQFPKVTFILAHMGSLAFVWDAIEVARAWPNVYLETSGMTSPRMLRRAVDEIGPERILFGSDYPYWHPAVERARIETAELGEVVTQMILGENVSRLLDLEVG